MSSNLILASSVVFVLMIILPVVFHLTRYLGATSDNIRKQEPYECGVRATHKDPYDTFNIRFYIVGILFLLFDVEVLFLFPWAINLRELGVFGLIEMFVFIFILGIAYVYVYKSGVLKWT